MGEHPREGWVKSGFSAPIESPMLWVAAGNASQKQIPKVADSLLVHLVVAPNLPFTLCPLFPGLPGHASALKEYPQAPHPPHHGMIRIERQYPRQDNPDISKCLLGSSSVPVAEHRALHVFVPANIHSRSTGLAPFTMENAEALGELSQRSQVVLEFQPRQSGFRATWILE